MKQFISKFQVVLLALAFTGSAQALTIIPTFDSSITTNANAGAMIAGINAAIQVFQANVIDPVTIKIKFVNDESVGLGQSLTWRANYSYSGYLSALQNVATSTYDANALSRIPNNPTDPVLGSSQIRMSLALARRMGLETDYGPDGLDSVISVKMSIINFSRPPADSEKYDLQQVVEHEIDEVLGTSSALPSTSEIMPIDLFRYTTNLVRTYTTAGDNAYFSVDGTNLLARFNMDSGGDYSDWWSYTDNWAPPGITAGAQVQDAFNTPGVMVDMGLNEYAMLDVIGWTLSANANALLNPPTVALTSPTAGAVLTSSPVQTVSGTASDNAASLASVRVALKRNSDNVWFNFTSGTWGSTSFDDNADTFTASGTTSWSAQLPGLANGAYTVQAQSVDEYGHGSKWRSVSFNISVSPPSVAFDPLKNNDTVFDFAQLGGTINRSATVTFRIQEYDAGGNNDRYWDGSAFVANSVYLPASVNGGTWSPAVALPGRGQTRYGAYFLRVAAVDAGGNASTNEILVTRSAADSTTPIVTLDNIHSGDVITNSFLPALTGLTVDPESGVASVNVYLNRFGGPDILYWNGSIWTTTPVALIAAYNSQNAVWQVTNALPSGGNLPNTAYQIQVGVENHEVPTGISLLSVPFTVDYHPVYVWTAGSWTDSISGNENNDWDNSANWDAGVPDTNGVVIINGTPTATGSKAVYALELNGGSLNTTGLLIHKRLNLKGGSLFGGMINLSSNAVCNWSAGTISGEWNILPGATLNLDTTTSVTMNSGSINNSGLFTWTNSGSLWAGNGMTISNNTIIDLRGNGSLHYNNSGQPSRLLNTASGIIRRSAGANFVFSSDYGGFIFENLGQLDLQTGTLEVWGDRNYLLDGGRITGGGRLAEMGGTLTMTGTTTFTNGTFALVHGQWVGNGQFDGVGTFDWQGGNINSAANFTIGANVQMLLNTSSDKWIGNSSVLNNYGTALAIGPGTFTLSSSATFNNYGQFEVQTNLLFFYDNAGNRPNFNNLPGALFRKTGTNLVTFTSSYAGVIFNNTGKVDVLAGKLQFGGGGTSSGEFAAAAGGEIEFNGQTQTLLNGASFTGAGVSRLTTAGRVNLGNTGSGAITLDGNLELAAGGSFGGTGQVLGTGTFNWIGGTLDSTFNLGPTVTMNISGPAEKTFAYGQLANQGTIHWLDAGQVWFSTGARLTNSGLFVAQGTATLTYNNAGSAVAFDNGPSGTLRKLGATTNRFGSEYGGVTLNNWGTIDAQEGVLLFDQSQKTFHTGGLITGNARIKNVSGTLTLAGDTALNGTLQLAGGLITGAGGFTGDGMFEWSGGQITSASLTNGAALTMLVSPGSEKSLNNGSILQQNGATIVTESGAVHFSNGSTFNNAGLFDFRTNATIFYDNAGVRPFFNNLPVGILRNSTTNVTTFDLSYGGTIFNNDGLVDAASGVVRFGGGGSSSGEFRAAAGARIEFTSQTQTLQNGASFTGAGVSRIIGGRVNLNTFGAESVTVNGTLELANTGFLGGNGQFLGTGAVNWQGGTLDGSVTLGAGVTMNLTGPDSKSLYGHIGNLGTMNWLDDGTIWCGLGGGITNAGLFHAQGTGSITYNNAGAPSAFDNGPAGILRKSGATTNRFGPDYGGVRLNNWGTIDVQAGMLVLDQGQKTLYAGGTISGASRLKNISGTLSLSGVMQLNGTLELAGGTFTGSGAFNGSGAFDWTGGGISSAQLTNNPGVTLFISPGAGKWLGNFSVVQQNGGTVVTEPGTVTLSNGTIFNNAGIFEVRTNTTFAYDNVGANPSFNNLPGGVLRKSGSGNSAFASSYGGINFHNQATIDLLGGNLAIDGPNDNAATALLHVALASSNNYPRETFAGNFGRNGALTITLTNGFVPADGMVFTIAAHGSASGEFLPVNLPSLPFPLRWKLAYSATATTLSVERAYLLSTSGEPVGGQFGVNFSGPAASAAVLETSTNLVDWVPVQTNTPFTGSFNFVDPKASDYRAKFYRVQIVP